MHRLSVYTVLMPIRQTNVALLAILNELAKYCDETTGMIDLDAFKIVYVAPMKALMQEMVRNFTARLSVFGICVGELTGNSQMTKVQIAATQIIGEMGCHHVEKHGYQLYQPRSAPHHR